MNRIVPLELHLPSTYSSKETGIYLTSGEHRPFWSYDASDIERRRRRLQNSRPEKLFEKNELEVFLSTLSPTNMVYWAEVEGELVYEADIKVANLKDEKGRSLRMPFQSSVWRDVSHPETVGVPAQVFWHCFDNSSHKIIGSDLEQTREGKAFWQYRVAEALQRGREVSINHISEDSQPARRRVERRQGVLRLSDLKSAYSKDPATGPLSFLLIQR